MTGGSATWLNKKLTGGSATWTNKNMTGGSATWFNFAHAEEGGVLRNVKNIEKVA